MSAYNTAGEDTGVYERIEALNIKEHELRLQIAGVRKDRAALKIKSRTKHLVSRPEWMDGLPPAFWWPSHAAATTMAATGPGLSRATSPPDLVDWQMTGGVKEFVLNVALLLGVVLGMLQLAFILF